MGYGQQTNKTIYCGKGREMGGRYGTFFNISLVLDDIPEEMTWVGGDGKRRVSLTMSELRHPDDRGNTHTIKVDGWKPPSKDNQSGAPAGRRPQPSRPAAPYPQRGYSAPPTPPRAPQSQHTSPQIAGPEDFSGDDIPF